MFGDIVKVTPSSKVVGDMALFMTANGLSETDIISGGDTLAFPESVIDLFSGKLGQTDGGFPEKLSAIILKGRKALTEPPGASMPPVDLEAGFAAFREEFDSSLTELDYLSFLMYPDVFGDFYRHWQEYGNIHFLPTPAFFYGLQPGEEILARLQKGKTISIRYIYRSVPDDNGNCKVTFELNGQVRSVQIRDESAAPKEAVHRKALTDKEIGAPLMGRLSSVLVEAGQEVSKDEPVFVIEAMKMETTITAPRDGEISEVHLQAGVLVEQGDLVLELA